jgi:hypothetical protein
MFQSSHNQAVRERWQFFSNRLTSYHLAWLTGTVVLLSGVVGSPVVAQPTTTLVSESFRNPTAFGWSIGPGSNGPACLTAQGASQPGSLITCGNLTDPHGNGAFRLTGNGNNQQTSIFYNTQIPTRFGLEITFDYFSYGGTAIGNPASTGDGLTFFLFDGNTPNNQARPGAFGGSLGYAQQGGTIAGLVNGYLGVGLDEFGNFANDTEGRGRSSPIAGNCAGNPLAALGRVLDSITIRGSGNRQAGYCFIANSGTLPQSIDVPNAVNRNQAIRRVRIVLNTQYQLSIYIDFTGTQNNPTQRILGPLRLVGNSAFPNQAALPTTLKFGFAASTGTATNIHEIRDIQVATVNSALIPPSCNVAPNRCRR